jgi:hypothetical protein
MAFQEKSAWVMSLSLLLGGVFYFGVVSSMSEDIGRLAPPILPVVAVYTAILIIVAVLGHIALAVFSPKDANASLDERERTIFYRAGHIAANVFGFGVLLSLGFYLFSSNGDALFYGIFASLMIGQLAEYAIRILLYRIGV